MSSRSRSYFLGRGVRSKNFFSTEMHTHNLDNIRTHLIVFKARNIKRSTLILKQVTNDNSILLIHTVQLSAHLSPLEIESRKGPQAED